MTADQQNQQQEFNRQYGGGAGMGGGNPFENMFNGKQNYEEDVKGFWEDLEDMFSGAKKSDSKRGKDISTQIEISFMDAIEGCQKTVVYERNSVCSTCNGTKAKPGTGQTKCTTCSGSGKVFYRQGFMTIGMECNACNGSGNVIKNPCTSCNGKGFTNNKATEEINVPKGVNDGVKLRVAKKGHYSQNGQSGDLFINVKVRQHPYFKREEFDIHTENPISISQAVLGAKIKIKTLTGETLVTVDSGTKDGDTKKLLNYGVPKLNSNNQRGHHYVKFKIVIPNKLTEKQKALFEELSKLEENVNK